MMQATQNRSGGHAVILGQLVTVWTGRNLGLDRFRNSRSERGMRSTTIVVADELSKDSLEVTLTQPNDPNEAISADGAYQCSQKAFACGARLGVFTTRNPKLRSSESRLGEKMPSRS
jgi:hypothetical protein